MNAGAAQDFLKYLRDNPAKREQLQDAVLEEIIAAGAAAGYTFTAHDLKEAIGKESGVRADVKGWGN